MPDLNVGDVITLPRYAESKAIPLPARIEMTHGLPGKFRVAEIVLDAAGGIAAYRLERVRETESPNT